MSVTLPTLGTFALLSFGILAGTANALTSYANDWIDSGFIVRTRRRRERTISSSPGRRGALLMVLGVRNYSLPAITIPLHVSPSSHLPRQDTTTLGCRHPWGPTHSFHLSSFLDIRLSLPIPLLYIRHVLMLLISTCAGVVNKPATPPTGDKRDFMSWAP